MANLNCPNCGGAIEGVSPLIRSIDCPYCSSWLRLSNQLWEANDGQKTPLDAPAFLLVGMNGSAPDGTHYTIRGRLRFQYGMGSWDEWWMESNGGESFWLEEDDGTYYRHSLGEEISLPGGNKGISVGGTLALNNGPTLFVTEKYQADIVGREGMLPVELEAETTVTYVDGVEDGEEYSLEIEGEYASISQSEEFDIRSIKWEKS